MSHFFRKYRPCAERTHYRTRCERRESPKDWLRRLPVRSGAKAGLHLHPSFVLANPEGDARSVRAPTQDRMPSTGTQRAGPHLILLGAKKQEPNDRQSSDSNADAHDEN